MKMKITPDFFIYLSMVLFSIGLIGVLVRRNLIVIFMFIELMLNAVNLSFIAYSYKLGQVDGQIYVFFVMVLAAVEVAVGLGLIMLIYRNKKSLDVDEINIMKN